MKTFDFTNLVKGEQLDSFRLPSGFGPTLYDENSVEWVHVGIGSLNVGYRAFIYRSDANGEIVYIDVLQGREAVCFCEGQDNHTKEWNWSFVCTAEFLAANMDKILAHETKRFCNKPQA